MNDETQVWIDKWFDEGNAWAGLCRPGVATSKPNQVEAFEVAWRIYKRDITDENPAGGTKSDAKEGWIEGVADWIFENENTDAHDPCGPTPCPDEDDEERDYGGDTALEEFEMDEDSRVLFRKLMTAREEIERLEDEVSRLKLKIQDDFEAAQIPKMEASISALEKVMSAFETYKNADREIDRAHGVIDYLEYQKLQCKPFKIVMRNSCGIYRQNGIRWYDHITDASRKRLMAIGTKANVSWSKLHMAVIFTHDYPKNGWSV